MEKYQTYFTAGRMLKLMANGVTIILMLMTALHIKITIIYYLLRSITELNEYESADTSAGQVGQAQV